MADDAPRTTTEDRDFAATAEALQDQIDALTETLEAHQRLFERLRATGLLPAGEDGRQR